MKRVSRQVLAAISELLNMLIGKNTKRFLRTGDWRYIYYTEYENRIITKRCIAFMLLVVYETIISDAKAKKDHV